jgi:hypothetical protein
MMSAQRNDVFSYLFFYFGQEKSKFSCGRIYFDRQHNLTAIEGHDITPFFKSGFFCKMIGQNKTKGIKKP